MCYETAVLVVVWSDNGSVQVGQSSILDYHRPSLTNLISYTFIYILTTWCSVYYLWMENCNLWFSIHSTVTVKNRKTGDLSARTCFHFTPWLPPFNSGPLSMPPDISICRCFLDTLFSGNGDRNGWLFACVVLHWFFREPCGDVWSFDRHLRHSQ